MDSQIQQYARTLALRAPGSVRVGPFVCRFAPDWPNPYANYAVPDDGTEPSAAEIRALISMFEEHGRLPRLEYHPSCSPALEAALLAAGFEAESPAPILACAPGGLVAPAAVPGLELVEAREDEELRALAALQHHAFGEPGEPTEGGGEALRRTYRNGGIVVLGHVDGEPAVGGCCSAPVDGLTELTGIAVAEKFRRRGLGAAVSAHVTALAHARGYDLPWLEPADAAVERVYARIGYRRVGAKLGIRLRAN